MKHHQEVFHAALSAVRLHSKITTHCEATSQGVILRLHLVMQLTSNPAGHAVLVPAVKRLTGVCLDGTLSLPKDVLLLVTFLRSSPKNDAVLEWSLKINKAEAEFKDQNAAAVCLLPLLASYFQENLGELFQLHQVTTEITEEFRNSLPASPVIVALGRSLFECSCQLFVDHEVMVEDVGFLQAVELLFALYYCLNIQYAKVLVPAVKRLTGVCLDGTLSLPKDVLLLVTFLRSSPKNDAVLEWSLKINKAEAEFKDQNAAAVCLLPLLASYFQENLGELFQLHQVTTEITEEFRNSLPASPVIVALGRSLFECSCQLFVDHEVMVEDVGFLQAVELLFAFIIV
ncbi:uncharacterized protein ISCGN_003374 [Ixodes scapularis]